MRYVATFLVAALALLSNRPSLAQTSRVITDPEVYAVYASTPWSSLVFERDVSRLLIVEDTERGPDCWNPIPAGWNDVDADYKRRNTARHRLQRGFDLGLPYDLLSTREKQALDARENRYIERHLGEPNPPQPRPYAQVPGGKLVRLSQVGFNADRTRAMFTVFYTCGPASSLCAKGWQLRRIKEDGVWRSISQQADYECGWFS